MPGSDAGLLKLLENMNLAKDGRLNLAGLLIFGEKPQFIKPAFIVKAVSYPGIDINTEKYLDSEDFEGSLKSMFDGSLSFIMRNLMKVQNKKGINSTGIPEIPRIVFEEILVNAFAHRDYFISAPIRIFIFSDRVEIISPGNLPNNLTVEKILKGNSNIRNPVFVSFISKGILPYRGLGTGILRAIENWPGIAFSDEREACVFKSVINRLKVHNAPLKTYGGPLNEPINASANEAKVKNIGALTHAGAPINASLTGLQVDILNAIKMNPKVTYDELADLHNKNRTTIMRNLDRLKTCGIVKRTGSKKKGHWEILEQ